MVGGRNGAATGWENGSGECGVKGEEERWSRVGSEPGNTPEILVKCVGIPGNAACATAIEKLLSTNIP